MRWKLSPKMIIEMEIATGICIDSGFAADGWFKMYIKWILHILFLYKVYIFLNTYIKYLSY